MRSSSAERIEDGSLRVAPSCPTRAVRRTVVPAEEEASRREARSAAPQQSEGIVCQHRAWRASFGLRVFSGVRPPHLDSGGGATAIEIGYNSSAGSSQADRTVIARPILVPAPCGPVAQLAEQQTLNL